MLRLGLRWKNHRSMRSEMKDRPTRHFDVRISKQDIIYQYRGVFQGRRLGPNLEESDDRPLVIAKFLVQKAQWCPAEVKARIFEEYGPRIFTDGYLGVVQEGDGDARVMATSALSRLQAMVDDVSSVSWRPPNNLPEYTTKPVDANEIRLYEKHAKSRRMETKRNSKDVEEDNEEFLKQTGDL